MSSEDPGGALFWLETTEAPQPKARRGRRARKPRPKPHPFCVPAAVVRKVLASLGRLPDPAIVSYATLLLPTTRFGPAPSPQLLHDWALGDDDSFELAPWKVEGLWLPAGDAFDVLAHLPTPEDMPSNLASGADSRYWGMVTGLVLEVLAQQKVIPVLVQADEQGSTYHARWLAVLDSQRDTARLVRLEAAMPPICRAAWSPDRRRVSPRSLLDSFIKTMADAQARRWARASIPLLTKVLEPAARHWIQALFTDDPRVRASLAKLKALDRSVQAWLRNLYVAGVGDFRVAFRLTPPNTPQGDDGQPIWRLDYLLQARDDPSLLVPAEDVWRTRGSMLRRLGRKFDRPQERLLAALGYAARLFPPINRSLQGACPSQLALSTDEAFQFLREVAPLLEQSGFGVLVPPWWNRRGARLGVRLRVRPKQPTAEGSTGRLSLDRLVHYEWELSVGDVSLTREEFEALVALKSPLVQVRGQWVQLDPEQVEAAIRFWQSQQWEGDADLLEALQMGLGAEESVKGLPVEDVAFEGWLDEWLKRLSHHEKLTELPQPASLRGQLRPYQRYGYSWLDFLRRWGFGACLADDMGLGKTVQTLALLLRDKERGDADGPVLLICPTSVVGNWQREAERFTPDLSIWIHRGSNRLRGEAFAAEAAKHDLVITSYALARRDAETLQDVQWRGVILDEAQNIKNPSAKQTQAIRRIPARFRIALTGTPVENRLSELWSIMQFLNPGYLGSREHFRKRFAIPVERYRDEEAARQLRSLVMPFILRRVKTDPRVIQDLPEKLEMKVYCNLTEEQASLYEAVVQNTLSQVEEAEGISRRGLVLSMLMQLKQICDHPALFLHQTNDRGIPVHELARRSGKLDRLKEMLEEVIAAGDRALVFTQFAEMGHMLHSYLQQALGCPVLFLHGGTPARQRDQMIARFQSENGPPIFVLSLKAGGTGLNLMRANHVFHFDRWWNPAVEDQATDRAFRIGQTRNVQVHKFVSIGTLEEAIDDLIESKRVLARAIMGSGEGWLTELSTDELRELVTLRRESVA
ncbi:MAG: DEAD/DEAH box helicase [Anaerolineae bacterium]|nr:DEAD/DEAH box helicase [Anaerolineae bacterium]